MWLFFYEKPSHIDFWYPLKRTTELFVILSLVDFSCFCAFLTVSFQFSSYIRRWFLTTRRTHITTYHLVAANFSSVAINKMFCRTYKSSFECRVMLDWAKKLVSGSSSLNESSVCVLFAVFPATIFIPVQGTLWYVLFAFKVMFAV